MITFEPTRNPFWHFREKSFIIGFVFKPLNYPTVKTLEMLVLFLFLFKDAGVKKSGVKLDLKFRAYVGKSLKSNFVIIFLHLPHVLEWIIFFLSFRWHILCNSRCTIINLMEFTPSKTWDNFPHGNAFFWQIRH